MMCIRDRSDIAPLFVIIGVIMSMFCKNQKVQRAGDVILGFGILFMGLKVMGESLTLSLIHISILWRSALRDWEDRLRRRRITNVI